MKYKAYSEVWLYPGMSGWHFVNIDKIQSKKIKEKYRKSSRGFGSIPVSVTLKNTTWDTSIFPDKKSNTYILPLKLKVRIKEGIRVGDKISFSIEPRI